MSFLCYQNIKNDKSKFDIFKSKTSANTVNFWSVHNIDVGNQIVADLYCCTYRQKKLGA